MAGIDWAIVAVVLLSVVLAAAKGLLYELFVLAGVVLGYLLAVWEYWRIAARIAPYVREPWLADIAGFFAIFFAVLLLAGIAGSIARWAMEKAGLRGVDRLLGGPLAWCAGW
ncbi:MAG TPA: CvpA family protein [Terriglobales bacterium]|nr:CvpA family protein [Terriglobales bacterium]